MAMLSIPLDTLGWILVKAREMEAAESIGEEVGSDPADAELANWIEDLTITQQSELVATMWLGRGDGDDFDELAQLARESRRRKVSAYLLDKPTLAEHLEAGLEALDYDISEVEAAAR